MIYKIAALLYPAFLILLLAIVINMIEIIIPVICSTAQNRITLSFITAEKPNSLMNWYPLPLVKYWNSPMSKVRWAEINNHKLVFFKPAFLPNAWKMAMRRKSKITQRKKLCKCNKPLSMICSFSKDSNLQKPFYKKSFSTIYFNYQKWYLPVSS